MNWKKGDIVKIGRTGHHVESHWVGFTSVLVSNPYKGSPDNFRMLYGNSSRKEYSEMNFWDCSVLVQPSEEEIRVFNEILPLVKERFKGITKIGDEPIEPFFNVFNGEVFASGLGATDYVKVWDKENGFLTSNKRLLLI